MKLAPTLDTYVMIGAVSTSSVRARAIRRIRWRLLPFLAFLYFIAYLDRVNVGFAALQMNAALGVFQQRLRIRRRHLLRRLLSVRGAQ